MYPDDIYEGRHYSTAYDYTGASGENEYWNGTDANMILDCVSYGTGVTGHIRAIESALGINIQGSFTNLDARLIDIEWASAGLTNINARIAEIEMTLGTYAHGGFTNITARWADLEEAYRGLTNLHARLVNDYDMTLGTYAHGGFTNLTARLIDVDTDINNTKRFDNVYLNFYYAGPIMTSAQFVSGISFTRSMTAAEMIVNALTPPVGAIGGHVELCGAIDGGEPHYLSVHMAADDFWGFVSGASCIPAFTPLYINIPTGSTMGGLNVTVKFT